MRTFVAALRMGSSGQWVASCAQVPLAMGIGKTPEEARADIQVAIGYVLADEQARLARLAGTWPDGAEVPVAATVVIGPCEPHQPVRLPNEFTAIVEPDGDGWWCATSPEVPGAIGQGRTPDEATADLEACIVFLLEVQRDDAAAEASAAAERRVVSIG